MSELKVKHTIRLSPEISMQMADYARRKRKAEPLVVMLSDERPEGRDLPPPAVGDIDGDELDRDAERRASPDGA